MTGRAAAVFVIRFRGGDLDRLQAAFDAHEPVRARHGALGHRLLRPVDSPDELMVVVEFASRGGALGYAADPDRIHLQREVMGAGAPHHRSWDEAVYDVLDEARGA